MATIMPDNDRLKISDNGTDLRITMRVVAPPFLPVTLGFAIIFLVFAELSGLFALLNGQPPDSMRFQLPWMTEAISKGPAFHARMLTWLAFMAVLLSPGKFRS